MRSVERGGACEPLEWYWVNHSALCTCMHGIMYIMHAMWIAHGEGGRSSMCLRLASTLPHVESCLMASLEYAFYLLTWTLEVVT